MITEEALAEKSATIRPHLDERQWRLLLGVEAEALGWGGIGLVARLSGASRTRVQNGVNERLCCIKHSSRSSTASRPAEIDVKL